MKIFIWGTGDVATRYFLSGELNTEDILGFIESKKSKEVFFGKKVFSPVEVAEQEYDFILVCLDYYGYVVYCTAKENNIDVTKMYFSDNYKYIAGHKLTEFPKLDVCLNDNSRIADIFTGFCGLNDDIKLNRSIITMCNGSDELDNTSLLGTARYNNPEYISDYFRYRTFELMAKEIKAKEVDGNVAEVGVYRGRFARLINETFSDRKMFLFDTFESFNEDEFKFEVEKGRCPEGFRAEFTNTSVEFVLSRMKYPQNCVVRKGFFPETANGLENEKFAFVSIDVDFEESILTCLRYFYPRMAKYGIIFVHDYNNRFLEGVKVAVRRYEKESGFRLHYVPIADEGGTLVIVK